MKTVTFKEFISEVVARSYTYNTIVEYNMRSSSPCAESSEPKDAIYRRCVALIGDLKEETLRKQYTESDGLLTLSGHKYDKDEMIQTAKRYVTDNFGKPNVLIDLGGDLLAVADINVDTVKLTMVSEDTGAIVLLNPRKHMLIKLTEYRWTT